MLSIPIHLKYTFDIVPIFNIYVFAGPTLSMGLGATEKLTATGEILGNTVSGSVTYNRYSGSVKSDSEDLNDLLDQNGTAFRRAVTALIFSFTAIFYTLDAQQLANVLRGFVTL